MAPEFTRRQFMHTTALASVGAVVSTGLIGCPPAPTSSSAIVFKRSGRGRRVSNAAKSHNANKLYRTFEAALNDTPHPGDHSKVVQRTISDELFTKLFRTNSNVIADLRRDL